MKKNLQFLSTLFSFALFLLFTACSDKKEDPAPSGENCLLTKIQSGNIKTDFVYAADILTRVNYDSAGAGSGYILLERNANNQVTKWQEFSSNGTTDSYVTLAYNGDGLINTATFYTKTSPSGSTYESEGAITYEYNSKILTRATFNIDLGGGSMFPIIRIDYTVNSQGNITKEMQYVINFMNPTAGMQFAGSVDYQYDDKKNAMKFTNFMLNTTSFSTNNVTSATTKDDKGAVVSTETNTYEYNTQGYPTKITTTQTGSTAVNSTVEYNCK